MSGAVAIQMPFEVPIDCQQAVADVPATCRSPLAGCSAGWTEAPAPPPVAVRLPSATAPPLSKPPPTRRLTVVLDMDECLLHSKFHGPNGMEHRQEEARPDEIADLNSFWVTLDDGDVAQVNKRPGLDAFLEALSRDHDTVVFTAAMPDYAGPVLDRIDPTGKLLRRRLYRDSCRQVKGAFLKDLTGIVANGNGDGDLSRVVLVDNNPLSFICQPSNGILVTSFYDEANDTALASVLQLIRHLESVQDVRPVLRDMFRLDTLLCDYRAALLDGISADDPAAAAMGGSAGAAGVPTGDNAEADPMVVVEAAEAATPGLPLEEDDEEDSEEDPVGADVDLAEFEVDADAESGCSGGGSCFGGDVDGDIDGDSDIELSN